MSSKGGIPKEYNNFKIPGTGCNIYGEQRLKLALHLRDDILPFIKNPYFIENGTLLGAFRNGKFIEQDDDFDYGVLLNGEVDEVISILNLIRERLDKKYACRLVSTYATKIEVFDPSFGSYLLAQKYAGADFHYVTVDLQFYKKLEPASYQQMYYIDPVAPVIKKKIILPLRTIVLENEEFPAPCQTHQFLVENYGSLDPRAKYNAKLGKYYLCC